MTAVALAPVDVFSHDTGVSPTPGRRRFTAADKLKILEEIDRCVHHGAIGALLRREGLYSSQLAVWRHARDHGTLTTLAGATPRRGPKPKAVDPQAKHVAKRGADLERQHERKHTQCDGAPCHPTRARAGRAHPRTGDLARATLRRSGAR